jgi:Domain of unknown function (DUF4190)
MTTEPTRKWEHTGLESEPSQRPPPPPPMQYPPQRPTSGLAVASMVLGILWLFWIGSILALIFGYIARKDIRKTGKDGNGLAIAGIVLGWVGVGTLAFYIVVVGALIGGSSGGSDGVDFQPSSGDRISQLHDQCAVGDMGACDDLYRESPIGSQEEEFGDTCGNRGRAPGQVWCDE